MAYHDFTLERVVREFYLTIGEETDLFSTIQETSVSDILQSVLEERIPPRE